MAKRQFCKYLFFCKLQRTDNSYFHIKSSNRWHKIFKEAHTNEERSHEAANALQISEKYIYTKYNRKTKIKNHI